MRTTQTAIVACCLAALVALPVVGDDQKPLVGPPAPPLKFKVLHNINTDDELVTPLAFSPNGHVLATAEGKRVRFWNPTTGKESQDAWQPEREKRQESGDITFLAFMDAKTIALSFAPNLVVQLRTVPSGKEVARLDLSKEPMHCLAAAEGLVATTSGSGPTRVRVWVGPGWAESWRVELPVGPIKRHPDLPQSLAFSPDRSELAVGTDYGHVYVYRVKDGKLLRSADPKKLALSHANVPYSPDGRELAVASGSFREVEEPKYVLGLWDAALKASRARLRWGALAREEPAHAYRCFFTPDGKTLVVPCANKTVRFYEVETGGLRHVGQAWVTRREPLSPNGRLLGTWRKTGEHWKLELLDWRAAAKSRPLEATALDALWDALALPDSAIGFQTVVALGAAPTQAARLISEKLKPVPPPKAETVRAWVADLGSDDFATREVAEKELAKLGDAVEAELREAAKSDVPERRDRASRLLKAATNRSSPERLRILRAVEVLEYADTPVGRDVLKSLAGGAASALLTHDAKAALARLEAHERAG